MRERQTLFGLWNERIAAAAAEVGEADFPLRLAEALRMLTPFTIMMVFAYRGEATPRDVYNNIAPDLAQVVVNDYIAGPYVLDPFFEAVRSGSGRGLLVLRHLAPDRFYTSEYYRQHYERTQIRDEVGFVIGLERGVTAVLSLTRQRGEPRFSESELRMLRQAAPLVRVLGRQHWAGVPALFADQGAAQPGDLDQAFAGFTGGLLTARETEVVRLILKGHSSVSIAGLLGISPGTVKIHRKHIYQKLAIASQTELFSRFIRSVNRIAL